MTLARPMLWRSSIIWLARTCGSPNPEASAKCHPVSSPALPASPERRSATGLPLPLVVCDGFFQPFGQYGRAKPAASRRSEGNAFPSVSIRVHPWPRNVSNGMVQASQPRRTSLQNPVAAVCDRRRGAENQRKNGGHRPPLQHDFCRNSFGILFSPAGHDFHNLQPVAGLQRAAGKLGGSHGLAVVFHDHAARQQLLRHQKFLEGAGELRRGGPAVGGHKIAVHALTLPQPAARANPAEKRTGMAAKRRGAEGAENRRGFSFSLGNGGNVWQIAI